MTTTHTTVPNRRAATAAALLLGLGSIVGVSACSDEDGDGGETDEEIQDVEDDAEEITDDVQDEVDEEVDAQNEGDNKG